MGAAPDALGFGAAGAAEETFTPLSRAGAGPGAFDAGFAGCGLATFAATDGVLSFALATTKWGNARGLQPGPKPLASNSVSYRPILFLPWASVVATSSRSSRVPARAGEQ